MRQSADTAPLCELIRQSEVAGVKRRLALLHTDRLPPSLARPHHLRLAAQAMEGLTALDRAQTFDLPRGRMAILWRQGGEAELIVARAALALLLSGQMQDGEPVSRQLLTVHDLPEDAAWLLDELMERPAPARPDAAGRAPLDTKLLARLEADLAQADLSHFARQRPVVALEPDSFPGRAIDRTWQPVWQERYFAVHELAASLYPDRHLRSEKWLFRRLTRTLDTRLLAMLSAPGDLHGAGALAINLHVATLLGREFQRFDDALPLALRGTVVVMLRAADMLADPACTVLARNFALARGYGLALACATRLELRFMGAGLAGLRFVLLALPELRAEPTLPAQILPPGIVPVATGLDRPSDVRWAMDHGFRLGRGAALRPPA